MKSLEDLPGNVRKSLKIEDFKLDKNGNITSTRPLTARRVRAVMSAIQEVTAKAAPNREEAAANPTLRSHEIWKRTSVRPPDLTKLTHVTEK